jgi:HK97 family phage major capsid protein
MSKLIVPTSVAEMQQMMDNPKIVAQIIENGQLTEFIRAYAKATDGEVDVQAQADRAVADALAKNGVRRPGLTEATAGAVNVAGRNRKAPGAGLDNAGYESLGDFAVDLFAQLKNTRPSPRFDHAIRIQNDFSSREPSAGGFLIPEGYRSEIMTLALERSVVRARATVLPMSSPDQLLPFNDSTSNASSVFGGFVFYWSEEGGDASATATNAKFGRTRLHANDLIGYSVIPNELLADAPGLNAWLMQAAPLGIAFYEDSAFFNGTGVGQPLGFLNAANGALISQAKEAGQVAATIVTENITKMFSRMLPSSLDKAVWIANQGTLPQLLELTINVGTGGAPVALVDVHSAPNMSILGRPLIISEKCAALGTVGDIVFCDFAYYVIGDRQAVSLDTSEHVNFATNSSAIRIIERVDGRPWLQQAFQPLHGSTVSPFVALATR